VPLLRQKAHSGLALLHLTFRALQDWQTFLLRLETNALPSSPSFSLFCFLGAGLLC
jgi:hypothetical protein